LYLTSGHPGEF